MRLPIGPARVLIAAGLLVFSSISLLSCKQKPEPPKNAEKEPAQKAAHWIPQYRFPASMNIVGANLAIYSFNSISVVSKDLVFVTGDYPDPKDPKKRVEVVMRTTDGGQNWKELPVDPTGTIRPQLNAICFLNANTGWAVGFDEKDQGLVMKSTDGGVTWKTTMLGYKQAPTSIQFVNENRGWIGGFAARSEQEEIGRAHV